MIKTKSQTKIVDTPVEITCDNNCGRTADFDSLEAQEFIQIRHTCGYGSVIGDGSKVSLDLCDTCFKELFSGIYRLDTM